MKPVLTITVALALTLSGACSAWAHEEKCEPVPKEDWKPQAELVRMLTNQGWKVGVVKITNGCYEVYGRDAKNQRMETFFHPRTFEIVTVPGAALAPK